VLHDVGWVNPIKTKNAASSSSTWVSNIEAKCDLHGLSLKVDEGFIPAVHNRDNTFDLTNFLRLIVDFEAGHVLPATFTFSADLRDERTDSLFRERTWRKAIPTRMHCIKLTAVTIKEHIKILSWLPTHFWPAGQTLSFLMIITSPTIRKIVDRAQKPDSARKIMSLLSNESRRTTAVVAMAQITARTHPVRVRLRYGRAEDTITASWSAECRNHTKQKSASIRAARPQKICALRVVFRLSPVCIVTVGSSRQLGMKPSGGWTCKSN